MGVRTSHSLLGLGQDGKREGAQEQERADGGDEGGWEVHCGRRLGVGDLFLLVV